IGDSGDRPLLESNFGHWLAAAARPPIDTPSTPAINFQRDNDMGDAPRNGGATRGDRERPNSRGRSASELPGKYPPRLPVSAPLSQKGAATEFGAPRVLTCGFPAARPVVNVPRGTSADFRMTNVRISRATGASPAA